MEAKIASLRKDVASLARSKDLEKHVKSHDANSKKLQQQVASLRAEVAALKAHVSKEAEKSRAKEEATLSKILAKVSKKPAAAKPPAKK